MVYYVDSVYCIFTEVTEKMGSDFFDLDGTLLDSNKKIQPTSITTKDNNHDGLLYGIEKLLDLIEK